MKVLLVEDEELYADQVEMLLDKMGHILIGCFDRSDNVLDSVVKEKPDLILMDVHIRGNYDGVELSQMIRDHSEVPIIFITSLKDDMTFRRASRVGASNFILKPFNQIQLQRAIELAVSKTVQKNEIRSDLEEIGQDHFFAKKSDILEKVRFQDIDYVEADGQYCMVYMSEKKYALHISLSRFREELPTSAFIQTHRSYIINRNKITSINPKENTIAIGGKTIPISRRNKTTVMQSLGMILE